MADDVFSVELALDRLEGELAAELPAHMRGFARAYAQVQPPPAAPAAAQRPASLELALRAFELARAGEHALAPRALALLRLLVPIAIESDPAVERTRSGEPTWAGWQAFARAREAVSRRRFGVPQLALMHWLHGCSLQRSGAASSGAASSGAASSGAASSGAASSGAASLEVSSGAASSGASSASSGTPAWPGPLDGWHERAAPIAPAFVERAWRDLADRHGVRGTCRIVHAPNARPRAFIVEPGREVIVVIGSIESAAQRFAALHELGHAVAALAVNGTLPRVVDEAAAAHVARLLEIEGALDLPWFTPIAGPARVRRRALAAALDAIERGATERPIDEPPWGLWNDPGAQTAYVEAELIADRWWTELGAMPPAGALAAALAAERARIDERCVADQTASALIA